MTFKVAKRTFSYFLFAPYVVAYRLDQDPWFEGTSREFFNRSVASAVMSAFIVWTILWISNILTQGIVFSSKIPTYILICLYVASWIMAFFAAQMMFQEDTKDSKSRLNAIQLIAVILGLIFYAWVLLTYLNSSFETPSSG